MSTVIGWDVGGANIKATRVSHGAATPPRSVTLPFEIWRGRERLPQVLQAALAAVTDAPPAAMALTMTAELSDVFATKREGVLYVLDSMAEAFPNRPVYALSLAGTFVPLADARRQPLEFAASNWLATALWLAQQYPDCLLVDIGSTTCDIIPILGGRLAVQWRTDLDRLLAGGLVYTGVLRTNVAAIVQAVPVRGGLCPVSAEYFAISGDVHLVLGRITPDDYSCPSPDGRPATLDAARGRLARIVCGDSELLSHAEIDNLAAAIYSRQVEQVGQGIAQVLSGLGRGANPPVLTLGLGAFLAREAARRLGLQVLDSDASLGRAVSVGAPSWAVAGLLAQQLAGEPRG